MDDARDFGAHGEFDHRAHAHNLQLAADQYRGWIALAGLVGATCDAGRHGLSRFWRGGLIGMALGTLGAMGLAMLRRGNDIDENACPATHGNDVIAPRYHERPI